MSTDGASKDGDSRADPLAKLVRRIEEGDQRAVDLLWHSAQKRLTAYLAYRFANIARPVVDEDDLASEAFVDLHGQIGAGILKYVITDSHFWAVAKIIANRRFAGQRRSEKSVKSGGAIRFETLSSAHHLPIGEATMGDCAELNEELLETVYRLQDPLVGPICKLRSLQLTRREIGDALKISTDTVDRRLHLLREALRARAIGKNCDPASRPKQFTTADSKSVPRYANSGGGGQGRAARSATRARCAAN